jgi:hypothetical protein
VLISQASSRNEANLGTIGSDIDHLQMVAY